MVPPCGSIVPVNPAPFEVRVGDLEHGVRTVSVRGELDLSTAPELEGPLDEVLGSDDGSVLIDLSGCEFIDSTGIALIVRAWQRLDGGLELSIPVHLTRNDALAALTA
jgi:anti-anti-sigma factor